jgi:hypothetical protein
MPGTPTRLDPGPLVSRLEDSFVLTARSPIVSWDSSYCRERENACYVSLLREEQCDRSGRITPSCREALIMTPASTANISLSFWGHL